MRVSIINGFLGSGKTTFILNILEELGGRKKIAVLVNELGEAGIDGSLIRKQEAEVVELTNGCICCSLTADLKAQILRIKRLYDPDLLLIEPTGAASVQGVLRVLEAPGMEEHSNGCNVLLIIDGPRFLDLYHRNRCFVEGQIRLASFVVINKCDRILYETAGLIRDTVLLYNHAAPVLLTRFGRISLEDWESFQESSPGLFPSLLPRAGQGACDHGHWNDFAYQTFSWVFAAEVEREALQAFLELLPGGWYGSVVRIKGLVKTTGGWFRIDYVPRELFWEKIEEPYGESRLFIIGERLEGDFFTKMLHELSLSRRASGECRGTESPLI